MAGTGPGDLQLLAEDLLAVSVDALDTIPTYPSLTGLMGAPERAFTSPGEPVWDCCQQLVVHVTQIADRFALPKAVFEKINAPSLAVTITRCLPEGAIVGKTFQPPTVAALNAAAAQHHVDGWALWNHIWNAIRADVFLARCTEVSFVSMLPFAPQGGCGGWQLIFNTILDGYDETFSS